MNGAVCSWAVKITMKAPVDSRGLSRWTSRLLQKENLSSQSPTLAASALYVVISPRSRAYGCRGTWFHPYPRAPFNSSHKYPRKTYNQWCSGITTGVDIWNPAITLEGTRSPELSHVRDTHHSPLYPLIVLIPSEPVTVAHVLWHGKVVHVYRKGQDRGLETYTGTHQSLHF